MQTSQLRKVLNSSIKRRTTLVKRLQLWQSRGNDAKCDQIYSQIWLENANIEYCQRELNLETV